MYADEISPEHTLSKNDDRKIWAMYWSVQHFGQGALGTEEPCSTLAIVRLTELENSWRIVALARRLARHVHVICVGVGVFILRSTSVIFIGDEPALAVM